MHSSQWNSLRSSLIQGGVPLWRAQRAIAELREHYLDLEAEALDAGLTPADAATDAAIRLGNLPELASEYLGHAELTTWWGKSQVAQLCTASASTIWQEHSGFAARWCFAMLSGALVTFTLLLMLHITIVGI